MANINNNDMLERIDRLIEATEREKAQAENEASEAEKLRNQAVERGKKAEEAREAAERAKIAAEAARKAEEEAHLAFCYDRVDSSDNKTSDNKTNNDSKNKAILAILIATLLVTAAAGIGYAVGVNSLSTKREQDDEKDAEDEDDLVLMSTQTKEPLTQEEYDEILNTVQSDLVAREDDFDGLLKAISNDYELLNSFVSVLNTQSILNNVSAQSSNNVGDIVEKASDDSIYQLINNADRVRDNGLSYNIMWFMNNGNTDGFIRFSNYIADETQRNLAVKIEDYIDKIAVAAKNGNQELASDLVDEFFTSLERGELYNVDNGVGYLVQRYAVSIVSDIIMNPSMNGTSVAISEFDQQRAEVLKGNVTDEEDLTQENGGANIYYRNLLSTYSSLTDEDMGCLISNGTINKRNSISRQGNVRRRVMAASYNYENNEVVVIEG